MYNDKTSNMVTVCDAKLRKIKKICKHFREYLPDVCKS